MVTLLTLDDWITSSGKYPGRAKSPELTGEVLANAKKLVSAVNKLLAELGVESVTVSSGYRPSGANAAASGARWSGHRLGQAIDLEDVDSELKTLAAANPATLRRLGLFLEDPRYTPSWCHLDIKERKDRPSRTFIP